MLNNSGCLCLVPDLSGNTSENFYRILSAPLFFLFTATLLRSTTLYIRNFPQRHCFSEPATFSLTQFLSGSFHFTSAVNYQVPARVQYYGIERRKEGRKTHSHAPPTKQGFGTPSRGTQTRDAAVLSTLLPTWHRNIALPQVPAAK